MYRVLIVDDEPIAIDSVEFIIRNNFKELEVGGRAKSGREAIEKAYNIRPDIILIDIKMPGINGLEAIRQIKNNNADVHFIVISAYDYFDYAAEAMTLGVVDYLLKPVKEARLVEALNKAVDTIVQKRRRISQELELKEKLEIIIPTLENGFIHSLCMFEDNTEELVNFSRLFELENMGGYVMAIEFGEKDTRGVQNKISASVKTQNHYIDFRDILKSMHPCIVGPMMLNRILVYVIEGPCADGFDIKTSAIHFASDFADRVRTSLGNVSIGIGRYYTDVLSAKKSCREAMQALIALSGSDDTIVHIDDRIEEYPNSPDIEEKFEHDIYAKVSAGDVSSALMAFDNAFKQISEIVRDTDVLRDKCIILVVGLSRRWSAVPQDFHSILNGIMAARSCDELKDILRKYITRMMNELSLSRQKKIHSIIEKANNYMAENYAKEITLEDIARVVNLSPYYFSRFYKEESGVNFIDRLIAIRIEKAKQYFENTDLSLKEVSGLVGYPDPNYFSKLFKKVTGYTATDYKEYFNFTSRKS